jgi:hypothetical protein
MFFMQDRALAHNATARVFHSNQSLVLQKVTRHSSGRYACSALNAEGETVSNELHFRVKCKCTYFYLRFTVHRASDIAQPTQASRRVTADKVNAAEIIFILLQCDVLSHTRNHGILAAINVITNKPCMQKVMRTLD